MLDAQSVKTTNDSGYTIDRTNFTKKITTKHNVKCTDERNARGDGLTHANQFVIARTPTLLINLNINKNHSLT